MGCSLHFLLQHVCSEAARVDECIASASEENVAAMGKLMDESMQSCAQDYE
jgi:galactokinase